MTLKPLGSACSTVRQTPPQQTEEPMARLFNASKLGALGAVEVVELEAVEVGAVDVEAFEVEAVEVVELEAFEAGEFEVEAFELEAFEAVVSGTYSITSLAPAWYAFFLVGASPSEWGTVCESVLSAGVFWGLVEESLACGLPWVGLTGGGLTGSGLPLGEIPWEIPCGLGEPETCCLWVKIARLWIIPLNTVASFYFAHR